MLILTLLDHFGPAHLPTVPRPLLTHVASLEHDPNCTILIELMSHKLASEDVVRGEAIPLSCDSRASDPTPPPPIYQIDFLCIFLKKSMCGFSKFGAMEPFP